MTKRCRSGYEVKIKDPFIFQPCTAVAIMNEYKVWHMEDGEWSMESKDSIKPKWTSQDGSKPDQNPDPDRWRKTVMEVEAVDRKANKDAGKKTRKNYAKKEGD